MFPLGKSQNEAFWNFPLITELWVLGSLLWLGKKEDVTFSALPMLGDLDTGMRSDTDLFLFSF